MVDRDASFELKATDKTGPAVKGAADGFEKLSDKADKAKRSIDGVGDEAGHLARKLAEARVAALGLAQQFDKTGDSKVLKEFEKINREAAKLGRVAKSIKIDAPKIKNPEGFFGDLVGAARRAGFIAGDFAVEGFGDAFKGLGTAGPAQSYIIAGLVGAAVAAAPIIAGAVEGAVLAGVASGGIAAGIILGAKDPRVVQAYSDLGTQVFTKLKADAQPFVGSLLDTAHEFGAAFSAEEPRVKRIFANLAPLVGILARDAIAAVHEIMPAIERASYVGGRILVDLGRQIKPLAGDIGDLLDAFSAGGPGAAAALGLIVLQLRGLIELLALGARGSAPFLNFFGQLAELGHLVPDSSGKISQLSAVQKDAGESAALTAKQYHKLSDDLGSTVGQAKALQETFDRLFGAQMSVDQANLAVNVGLTQLTETIKGNKKTLDEHTAAGQQNVGVIYSQIETLNRKREADIAAGNGTAEATAKANAAYASQLEGLRNLLYSLGLNHAEVDRLIGAYEELAKPQTKTFTTIFKNEGTPYERPATGHARNTGTSDLSALSGWAPAAFNAGRGAEYAGGGGGQPFSPAVELHAEQNFVVQLDGKPFRAVAIRTVDQAAKRSAWRAKVGRR